LKYKVPKQTEGEANPNLTAVLVAKAYDPVGGVCLKYETNRAVEVGRLMLGFQELGEIMQNIPRPSQQNSTTEDGRGEKMDVDTPDTAVEVKDEQEVTVEKNAQPTSNESRGGKKKKKKR
jgi:hypothetical protein